jgi:hypothetical protein
VYQSNTLSAGSATGCVLNAGQQWPRYRISQHETFITNETNGQASMFGLGSASQGPNFARSNTFVNDIFVGGGGWTSTFGEGTKTQKTNWDPTTLVANHLVFTTRTAANYTEYGPGCANPSLANMQTVPPTTLGCSPPSTVVFPAHGACGTSITPGATTCVGFTDATTQNTSTMPVTLNDYHGFKLAPGTYFAAGGSGQASDGTDLGANIPAIDAAETLTKYVCGTACGAGPFADNP